MNIEWTSALSINDERIDKEHQLYFDLLNRLHKECAQGASKKKLRRLFEELMLFIRFHFMAEENVMIDMKYEGYKEHRMAHARALDVIKSKLYDYENDAVEIEDILEFAVEWFLLHISTLDRDLGKFLAIHKQTEQGTVI